MNELLKPGNIIIGEVNGFQKYGIFLRLKNDYNGMIHISEISDKFVSNLNLYARKGDKLLCKILEVNHATKKVKLSIKNLDDKNKTHKKQNLKFKKLQVMLPKWIEEKMLEISK